MGSSGSLAVMSGSSTASGSTGSVAPSPRVDRKLSSALCREVSARTMASWACDACSSARKTSSLLTSPTCSRASDALSRLWLRFRLCRATARSWRCRITW
jgi:hypothetical protein